MTGILLTQNSTPIFKYIVWVLGKIMEGIFYVLDLVGIPNIGLSIIFFTIVVNVCMLPLTYKQQKFSKLQLKMNPEIKAIQKKYEGKKDNDSAMKQNAEMQEVYAKYGVSPTGSCLFMLIQMPILFALYRVIYAMPSYVGKIRDAFFPLVDRIIADEKAIELVRGFSNSGMFARQFDNEKFTLSNTIIDCLNRASTADFESLKNAFPSFASDVTSTMDKLNVYNSFLGINTGNSPWFTIKNSLPEHAYLAAFVAVMIPILAGLTQWINIQLSPQQTDNTSTGNSQADSMAASMKTMNYTMPLMSVWFCFTLPAGMGLYWVAGAVVRSVIQIIMNKKIDSMDMDQLIKDNSEKSKKKLEKMKVQQERMNAYANMNTKNIDKPARSTFDKANIGNYSNSSNNSGSDSNSSTSSSKTSTSGGSMMAKANMVKDFNERNNK